jgi:hypothetical protein
MWQKCPVCNGTSDWPQHCDVCKGTLLIHEETGKPPLTDPIRREGYEVPGAIVMTTDLRPRLSKSEMRRIQHQVEPRKCYDLHNECECSQCKLERSPMHDHLRDTFNYSLGFPNPGSSKKHIPKDDISSVPLGTDAYANMDWRLYQKDDK